MNTVSGNSQSLCVDVCDGTTTVPKSNRTGCGEYCIGGSKGSARDTSLFRSNFFHFHAVFGKRKSQIIGFWPKFKDCRSSPRLRIPGSATVLLKISRFFYNNVGKFVNIDVKGYYSSTKVTSSGARPDDHWFKSLMLSFLS